MPDPKIVRPEEPDFHFHELFPGNMQPRPISAISLDPEAVRTVINNYHDNFKRQKRFDREMGDALEATNKRIDTVLNYLIVLALCLLITLGIALR